MTALVRAALLVSLALPLPGWTQDVPRVPAVQESDKKPGYGTVEKVQEVRVVPERSAAAGGSAAAKAGDAPEERPAYRVTVRMADGSVQQRDLHKPEFKAGDNVLLTNAGDIVKD